MSDLRLVGLVSSLLIFAFVIWQYAKRRFRRGDLLLGLIIAFSLAGVALYPPIVNGLQELLRVQTRPMALAILGIIVLFGLFLHVLNELLNVRRSMGDLVRALAMMEYQKASVECQHNGITIIIPAYNEEKNLEKVLPVLPACIGQVPVRALVIVDGSRDRSATVARRYAVPVTSHALNRGQGDALRTGFDLASQDGAQIIVTMDADGQHRPEEIERLVMPLLVDEADYVMGSRFLGHYAEQGGVRHIGIVLFSALISALTGAHITDCTNGFRAIRASGLARLDLRENRFSAPELIIEAANKGLRICEVPVTILARGEGHSKKPRSWRYPLGFALVILRTWLRS